MSIYLIIKNGHLNWIARIGRSRGVVSADEAAWIFYLVQASKGAV